MNRTKLLTIAVIGLLLINLGTLGVMMMHKPPRPPHGEIPPPPPNGEGPKQIIIDRLHFDENQQKQYEVFISEHRKKTDDLHNASKELHNQLYIMLKSESIDKAKSDSLIEEIADNQKAIENLNFNHFQEIKSICKPEQLEDFNELAGELAMLFGPRLRP
jgi:protein CpxP